MFAFVCPVASREEYETYALPGIRRAAETDSLVLMREGLSLQGAVNQMLDELATIPDLEGAIVLHEDVEILEDRFLEKLREAFVDPLVAIVGVIGARNVRSLAYWEGEQLGGVWAPQIVASGVMLGHDLPDRGEADAVDGVLMALSPWAVRELRLDPVFAPYMHGYDVDLCFQARSRGYYVRVEPLEAVHHSPPDFLDRQNWIDASIAFRRKWSRPIEPGR